GVPWARLLAVTMGKLVREIAVVGTALLRALLLPVRGLTERQPFAPGEPTPAERARRGLVRLALSAAPNGYVTGEDGGALLLHRLRPGRPDSPDRRWPL
ncbi:MAG TPA: hypothetical protein VE684_16945, partial [Crenalkalicoccus sp.]|nr:hypothetical protein [Crenalkalicoccus sp.]